MPDPGSSLPPRLVVELNALPPSVNKAYETIVVPAKGKGRARHQIVRRLSDSARAFKVAHKTEILREVALLPELNRNADFTLDIVLYGFDRYSSTWPKQARYRHKRHDVSNHIKIVEDLLCECTALDDSQFVRVSVTASPEEGRERTVIILTQIDDP